MNNWVIILVGVTLAIGASSGVVFALTADGGGDNPRHSVSQLRRPLTFKHGGREIVQINVAVPGDDTWSNRLLVHGLPDFNSLGGLRKSSTPTPADLLS